MARRGGDVAAEGWLMKAAHLNARISAETSSLYISALTSGYSAEISHKTSASSRRAAISASITLSHRNGEKQTAASAA